ncbi:MAG: DHHW family protein [Clostridia bacterium]|nr:DHHW family protein [Clostridia bacterium]
MKKNGKGSFLAALWWLMGSLCLGALLLLLSPRESRFSQKENRMLAGFPQLTAQSLQSGGFFSGLEDFLCDGFFGRDEVVDWTDSALALFDKRTEEQRQIQEAAEIERLLEQDAQGGGQTPEPTIQPMLTPSPALTETPAPTPAPTPTPSATPMVTATPAITATPMVTATPPLSPTAVPTATPRVIVPLESGAEYTLELMGVNGKNTHVYSYPAENLMAFAQTLNTLAGMLPEDGEVHYLQVPVSGVGRRVRTNLATYNGWVSTMEDALQTQVAGNVHIHNAPAILNDALVNKEDVFYHTDHHWTPLGAWYAVNSIMESRGYPTMPFEEYAYFDRLMGRDDAGREDWLHLLEPLAPTHSYVLTHLTEAKELDFMNREYRTYIAYINNTRLPWRRFTGGFGNQRRALLISDSFGNVFLPYLLPYYGEVHMTDLRENYYSEKDAGGTFRELLAYHEVDDVYVVLSTANGINSYNSLTVFDQTIRR